MGYCVQTCVYAILVFLKAKCATSILTIVILVVNGPASPVAIILLLVGQAAFEFSVRAIIDLESSQMMAASCGSIIGTQSTTMACMVGAIGRPLSISGLGGIM